MAADTSVSFAILQQEEQAEAGGAVVFWYPLGSVPTSHFADLTDAVEMGTNHVLGDFNHLLQSPSVLGRDESCLFVIFPVRMLSVASL